MLKLHKNDRGDTLMEKKFITHDFARELMPPRRADGNKGTFGKALLLVGSEKYRGAALLATEAALRGGAGYVIAASEGCVTDSILLKLPEAILVTQAPFSALSDEETGKSEIVIDRSINPETEYINNELAQELISGMRA